MLKSLTDSFRRRHFFAPAGVVSRPEMLHFATTAPVLTQAVHGLTQAGLGRGQWRSEAFQGERPRRRAQKTLRNSKDANMDGEII